MSILSNQRAKWAEESAKKAEASPQSAGTSTNSNTSLTQCPKCNGPFKEVGITIGTDAMSPLQASFCPNCRLTSPR